MLELHCLNMLLIKINKQNIAQFDLQLNMRCICHYIINSEKCLSPYKSHLHM